MQDHLKRLVAECLKSITDSALIDLKALLVKQQGFLLYLVPIIGVFTQKAFAGKGAKQHSEMALSG